ncbi:MAG: type II secretion system F family protein [Pseudomonadota bacterium]
MARQLMLVGEESARLAPMRERAATLAETWLKTEKKRVIVLLEPLSMIVVGVMVLAIVLSVLLPIFDLQSMVGNP